MAQPVDPSKALFAASPDDAGTARAEVTGAGPQESQGSTGKTLLDSSHEMLAAAIAKTTGKGDSNPEDHPNSGEGAEQQQHQERQQAAMVGSPALKAANQQESQGERGTAGSQATKAEENPAAQAATTPSGTTPFGTVVSGAQWLGSAVADGTLLAVQHTQRAAQGALDTASDQDAVQGAIDNAAWAGSQACAAGTEAGSRVYRGTGEVAGLVQERGEEVYQVGQKYSAARGVAKQEKGSVEQGNGGEYREVKDMESNTGTEQVASTGEREGVGEGESGTKLGGESAGGQEVGPLATKIVEIAESLKVAVGLGKPKGGA